MLASAINRPYEFWTSDVAKQNIHALVFKPKALSEKKSRQFRTLCVAFPDCEPPTKIECGRQGFKYYTAQKCVEDKRCCWNENNVPNCYYKGHLHKH